jgi:hypothetical protein
MRFRESVVSDLRAFAIIFLNMDSTTVLPNVLCSTLASL